MKNIEKINDYLHVLNTKTAILINDSENLFVLASVILIFAGAWLFSKFTIKRMKRLVFPHSLAIESIMPLLAIISLSIMDSLYYLFTDDANPLITFFIKISIAMLIIRLIIAVLKHVFTQKKYVKSLTKFVQFILWISAIIFITDSNNDIVHLLDNITFRISKNNDISIWDVIYGITVLISALIIAILTNQFLERKIAKLQDVNTNLQQILIRLSKIIIFILAFMIALTMIGVDMTALSVFGGAIGVGIGFGLQKIASNFLSGFIILFDRSIKVGDRLVVDNHAGLVDKITMRYVVLERFDGTEVLIPNETFVTSSIQNQSYSSTKLRGEVLCGISDENNILEAIDLIKVHLQQVPNTLQDKASVNINRMIDGGVELKCQFWVEDPNFLSRVTNQVYVEIIECFKAHEIIAPVNSQRVELIKNG